MENEFYKNKTVLITGADGFVGSHLTEALLEAGAFVSILVRGTSHMGTSMHNFHNLNSVKTKIKTVITGDIANNDIIEAIRQNKPQIIFHLAANAYVPYSFEHPIEVAQANVMGTLNILEAARKMKIERVVITSSSEVYGNPLYVPIDEKHPLNPTSPYAASKAAADRYAFSYWNTYKLPIAIIRPFNTYGPRHTYDVIPKFIALALENKPITIYGSGNQRRDFVYVKDMVQAFMIMGSEQRAVGECINFGTGKSYSVLEIAEKVIRICNSQSKLVHVEPRLAEVEHLLCDNQKAKEFFAWNSTIDIDEGIALNVEYVKKERAYVK
ncbi:MAG: GDP-mannose 4,6-dehydratase [Candidatus Woesearchaeota archaeon]|jgi:GDP-mannose 4,6-dehydratase